MPRDVHPLAAEDPEAAHPGKGAGFGGARFGPVDAARLAQSPRTYEPSRAVRRVLTEAARLWCLDLSLPTVRTLARAIGRRPTTVLNGFGHMIDLYAEVIRREWDDLEIAWHQPTLADRVDRLVEHALRLSDVSPVLLRLPSLVNAAVAAAAAAHPPDRTYGVHRAMPLHVLAAFAEPEGGCPRPSELRRVLLIASTEMVDAVGEWQRPA